VHVQTNFEVAGVTGSVHKAFMTNRSSFELEKMEIFTKEVNIFEN